MSPVHRCLGCNQAHSSAHVKQAVFEDRIPRCRCGDLIKPDIVFFGEQLPERFFDMVSIRLVTCSLVVSNGRLWTPCNMGAFSTNGADITDICRPLLAIESSWYRLLTVANIRCHLLLVNVDGESGEGRFGRG